MAWYFEPTHPGQLPCAVLRGNIQRCEGGLWYEDYETFEHGLNRLLDSTEAATMGEKWKAYVQGEFPLGPCHPGISIYVSQDRN